MVYNFNKKKQSKGGLACVSGSTNGLEEKRIKGVGEKSNGRERLTDEKKIKNKKSRREGSGFSVFEDVERGNI
jgi:hypothetical protein